MLRIRYAYPSMTCAFMPQKKSKSKAAKDDAEKLDQKENSNGGLHRTKSMSSGLDLIFEPASVRSKKSFFESVLEVSGRGNGVSAPPPWSRQSSLSKSNLALNKSGSGLNEVGTEFLGLRYLDETYGKDQGNEASFS